jgi:ppGpp synthetase/RelA/SpoT-type nucleotidyltranferase
VSDSRVAAVSQSSSRSAPQFGYAQFGSWYDAHRADVLEPALTVASGALHDVLMRGLSERDHARIRSITGRVKSKRRTWRKVRQPRYQGRIHEVDDIPHVIDDLIGLRVTCINLRDIDMVQSALDNVSRVPARRQKLWLDVSSERDYVLEPKESGYRGWHVNMGVSVPVGGQRAAVTAELQVRTLLQDSWGELTHEDTYSKDGALPPLVEVLSKRMADLFATLDDIAEDLRTELDRLDEALVAEEVVPVLDQTDAQSDVDLESGQAGDAATLLVERWRHLERPVDLASLAWTLQHEFGAEVSDDWFGHRSFKRFLRHAVPDGEISTGRQAYLLPPGDSPAEIESDTGTADEGDRDADESTATTVPAQAMELRRIDQGFPILERDQWPTLYNHLAEAWARSGPRTPSARFANQLTRSARDRAAAAGTTVSRRHLGYIVKTVLSTGDARQPLDAAGIADAFAAATVQRMIDVRVLNKRDRHGIDAVTRWLTGS